MRRDAPPNVRDSLLKTQHVMELSPEIIAKAKLPLERMIAIGRQD